MMHIPTRLGYEGVYTVQSDSMAPDMRLGDVIYLRRVDPEEIKVGDIITYKAEGAPPKKLFGLQVNIVYTAF